MKGNEFNGAVDTVGKGKKKRGYRQYLYVKGSYDIPLTKDQLDDGKVDDNSGGGSGGKRDKWQQQHGKQSN